MSRIRSVYVLLTALLLGTLWACDTVNRDPVPAQTVKALPVLTHILHTAPIDSLDSLQINPYDSLHLGTDYSLSVSAQTFGTVTFRAALNLFVFRPLKGFYGTDTLRFRVCNTKPECETLKVLITVRKPLDTSKPKPPVPVPPCPTRIKPKSCALTYPNTVFTSSAISGTDTLCSRVLSAYSLKIKRYTTRGGLNTPVISGTDISVNTGHINGLTDTVFFYADTNSVHADSSYMVVRQPSCPDYFRPLDDTLNRSFASVVNSTTKLATLHINIAADLLANDLSCPTDIDATSFAVDQWKNNGMQIIGFSFNAANQTLTLQWLQDSSLSTHSVLEYKVRSHSGWAYKTASVHIFLQ